MISYSDNKHAGCISAYGYLSNFQLARRFGQSRLYLCSNIGYISYNFPVLPIAVFTENFKVYKISIQKFPVFLIEINFLKAFAEIVFESKLRLVINGFYRIAFTYFTANFKLEVEKKKNLLPEILLLHGVKFSSLCSFSPFLVLDKSKITTFSS